MAAKPEENKSLIELLIELFDLINSYFKQELRASVRSGLIKPAQRLGIWMGLTIVASTLFGLAAIFLAVGSFQLLARLVGAAWIAYFIVGGALLLAGILLIALKRGPGNVNNPE